MFDTQEMRAPGLPADTAPSVPLPPSGQPTHLLDRLNAVFKHRRIAATAFLLVLGAMMIQSYSTTPVFETFSQIEIADERSTGPASIGLPDPTSYQELEAYYKTQYQVIKSREVGRRVVDRLNLTQSPLFSDNAPKPRDPLSLLREARASATEWVRGLISGSAPNPEPVARDEASRKNAVIGAVIGGARIDPVEDTKLVRIFYQHTDPQFAAVAANAIAEEYAAFNLEKRLENTQHQLTWLKNELKEADQRALEAEQQLAQYREENDAQSLESGSNVVGSKYNELNSQLIAAESTLITASSRWNLVKDVEPKDDGADAITLIGADTDVSEARAKLMTLEAQQQTLGLKYGKNHPDMQRVGLEISAARDQLISARTRVKDRLRSEYQAAATKKAQLQSAIGQAGGAVSDLERKRGDYQALVRRAEAARDLHKRLLSEHQTYEIAANSKSNNVRVMDPAQVPGIPITPNTRKDLITAILAGLTLALGLAFGIEYLDDSVKTPEDVTRRLRLPLLGLVPAVRGERVPVLTETVPHDFGEAFRSLRTSLVFTSGGEATRIITVTSSQPLEGKTTTACNLALALALGGSRVLLIDADMRRPGLHKTIGIQNGIGLSHLLTGQSRVREVVQRTREPNLFVITAGRTPPNPSELLASERMDHFLANLTHGPFDWVVVDTPPVLAVTDAVILAQKIGTVVFVIGSEMTRRVHAERALETLQASKARSIGAVLNRVDFDRNKYYYARYYGYQYKSYYGQNNQPPAA